MDKQFYLIADTLLDASQHWHGVFSGRLARMSSAVELLDVAVGGDI
jgi:hypothetical protein